MKTLEESISEQQSQFCKKDFYSALMEMKDIDPTSYQNTMDMMDRSELYHYLSYAVESGLSNSNVIELIRPR